jgi:hypothetical protein
MLLLNYLFCYIYFHNVYFLEEIFVYIVSYKTVLRQVILRKFNIPLISKIHFTPQKP